MLFFIVSLTALTLMYGYIGGRLIPRTNLPKAGKAMLWLLTAAVLVMPFVHIFLRMKGFHQGITDFLGWTGYTVLGVMSLLCWTLVIMDGSWWLFKRLKRLFLRFSVTVESEINPPDPLRRALISRTADLSAVGLCLAAGGYGFFQARREPAVMEVDIPIKDLHPDLRGFRIVQFSDLHVGPTIKGDFAEMVTERINALKGDLIAFTGDLVDGSVANLREHTAPLKALSAPHGKYFITGNHEYYSGVGEWIEEAGRLGFDVLIDENRTVEKGKGKITLAGVTDISARYFHAGHRSDPFAALKGAGKTDMKILLAHQPKSIDDAAKAGYDLQISGHTHGGQYFPGNLMVRLDQPHIAGLYRHNGTWLYVNRGTGYWGPPLRLGARSEITVLTLKHSAS